MIEIGLLQHPIHIVEGKYIIRRIRDCNETRIHPSRSGELSRNDVGIIIVGHTSITIARNFKG